MAFDLNLFDYVNQVSGTRNNIFQIKEETISNAIGLASNAFTQIDADGSGSLSRGEIQAFLDQAGTNTANGDIVEFANFLNTDERYANFQEITQVDTTTAALDYQNPDAGVGLVDFSGYANTLKSFHFADINHDELLTAEEMQNGLIVFGGVMTDTDDFGINKLVESLTGEPVVGNISDQINQFIADFDTNGDNKLSLAEVHQVHASDWDDMGINFDNALAVSVAPEEIETFRQDVVAYHASITDPLEDQIDDLQEENTDLQTTNNNLQDDITDLETENNNLQTTNSDLQDDITELQTTNATLQNENTTLRNSLDTISHDLEAVRQETNKTIQTVMFMVLFMFGMNGSQQSPGNDLYAAYGISGSPTGGGQDSSMDMMMAMLPMLLNNNA